jgi:hypothetical protein
MLHIKGLSFTPYVKGLSFRDGEKNLLKSVQELGKTGIDQVYFSQTWEESDDISI